MDHDNAVLDQAYDEELKEKTSLQVKQFMQAPREKVFRALTQPELIKRWFAPGNMIVTISESDPRVGGAYKIQMQNDEKETFTTYGEYLEIIENKKLVYSWGWELEDRHESQVTIDLYDKDGGTEVCLTHIRHRDEEAAKSHTNGWVGCFRNLAERIADFPD